MLRTEAVLHRDEDTLLGFVAELAARYAPPGVDPEAMRAGFAQAGPQAGRDRVHGASAA